MCCSRPPAVAGGRAAESLRSERGLILLEVLVALVILGLVVVGYLQLLHASHELIADSRTWSEAVAFAGDGMERAKLEAASPGTEVVDTLPGGYRRQTNVRRWQPGLLLVTVTVVLPTGSRFEVDRLERDYPVQRVDSVSRAGSRKDPW
jgi:hypothetical protein